jgi:hypothetical protein
VGYLVLLALALGAAVWAWERYAAWIVAGIVIAVIFALAGRSRRRATSGTAPAAISPQRGTRRRAKTGPSRLTRLDEVVPVPRPAGWPVLPVRPNAMTSSGILELMAPADRPYARTTCPSCSTDLDPLPKAKKRCRHCGQDVYVRSGPDGRRHLLAASEMPGFEILWTRHHENRSAAVREADERAEIEWLETLRRAGFAVGSEELDVVGESYYHPALAGIRAAEGVNLQTRELSVAAALVAEPQNQWDSNTVGVYVNGAKVGHLEREDAADYQRPIQRAGGRVFVEATLVGGRPTDRAEVGPIGVRIEHLPPPDEIR